jgi:hypothetical protein
MFWSKWFAPKVRSRGFGAGAAIQRVEAKTQLVAILQAEPSRVFTVAELAGRIGRNELYTEERLRELWLWGRSVWKVDPIRFRAA